MSVDEPRTCTAAITIDRIEGFAVCAHPSVGPVSSLGTMPVRNGVLIAITSTDGVTGWGEIWCNFPPRGNLARLNLLHDVIAPLLFGSRFDSYADCRPHLETVCARMAIHIGEFGPFAHCFAGLDTALADLAARQAGLPLAHFLSPKALTEVPTYASTPDVGDLGNVIGHIIEAGHKGLKLKIGQGRNVDTKLLRKSSDLSQGLLKIYVDANQNWSVDDAIEEMTALAEYSIGFVEEPIPADAPLSDWAKLASSIEVPLAGGENITSRQSFADFMDRGHLSIVQPDVAKWGGVSGAYHVGQLALERGVTCAMHYMGTGLGLAASIHTLAAIGGHGPVELDSNPNPLRTDLGEIDLTVTEGKLCVPTTPGHGFTPDPVALKSMTVAHFDAT